jgi:hypothetical protein
VAVPVYLAELAPTERRGSLSGRNELAIVVGQMLAFMFNAVIASLWGDHAGVWRYMLFVWRFLPNTSGRSLDVLEESFMAGDFR